MPSLSAAIAFSSINGNARRMAEAIAEGCRLSGADARLLDLEKPLPDSSVAGSEVLFLGFDVPFASVDPRAASFASQLSLQGRKVAIFSCYSYTKSPVGRIAADMEKKGAVVLNTISLKSRGVSRLFGRGSLDDVDLSRASAFGERTINNLLHRRVVKENRKSEIENYRQPRQQTKA